MSLLGRHTRLRLTAGGTGEYAGAVQAEGSILGGARRLVVSDPAGRVVARLSRPGGLGRGLFAVRWRVDVLDAAALPAQMLVLAALVWQDQVPLGEHDACNRYFYDTLEFVVLPLVALALDRCWRWLRASQLAVVVAAGPDPAVVELMNSRPE